MIHRRCQDRITTLETELRTTRDRITDRDTENAVERSRADREERARWDAAGETELLKDRLDAAQERERDLEHQIWQLECQINDLTEDDSPVAVARTRQTRVVTRALAAGEDNRAQALATLPWQAFHPEPELHRPGRWWMDGDEWNIHEIRNLLRWRYGLTAVETRDLLQERQAAMSA